jgi:hypothetical protein
MHGFVALAPNSCYSKVSASFFNPVGSLPFRSDR